MLPCARRNTKMPTVHTPITCSWTRRGRCNPAFVVRAALVVFAGVLSVGCISTPPLPPVWTPTEGAKNAALTVGATLPPFGSSYERDGRRIDAVWTPRVNVVALSMLSFGLGLRASDACAVDLQLSVARSGGMLRCGAHGHGSYGIATGLLWSHFESISHRTALEAGYRDGGWLVYASSGFSGTAAYGRTFVLQENCVDCLFGATSPSGPLLVASQLEVAWSSMLALGVPPARDKTTTFFGMTADVPLAFTSGSFTKTDDDAHVYRALRPGVRIGVVLGISGNL